MDKTKEFKELIDYQVKNGGGTVILPIGRHIVSTIEIKSNTHLVIPQGCVLEGINGIENYQETGYFHNELWEVKYDISQL